MELLAVPSRKVVLAFGLDRWAILDPFESPHAQIMRWKDERNVVAVSYRTKSDTVYGLSMTTPAAQQVKGQRLLSGAACAAMHPALKGKTALVTIEVPGAEGGPGAVAFVQLERGVVTLERVVDPHQVSDLRQQFAQRFKGEFEVYGVAHTIPQVHHALDLEGLVPKKKSAAALAPLRSNRAVIVATGVVVVALVAVAAYMTWSSWEAKRQKIAQQLMLRQQEPAELYKQSMRALMETPVTPLADALQTMREQLADFPLVVGGWEFVRMSCGPTGACAVRFKRMSGIGVTIADFRRAALPEWGQASPVDQEELAFTITLPFQQSRLQRDAWPSAAVMRERNFEQWQYLQPGGWKAELGQMKMQGVPAGLSQQKAVALEVLPEVVYAMPLTINDQQWWYVDGSSDSPVQEALLGKNTVMAGDIDLAYANRSIQFSAKGLSYVVR